jgi:hypothetical protein
MQVERADTADVPGDVAFARIEAELAAALRRRPAQEARLAGGVRTLCRYSPQLRKRMGDALETMVRRSSYERPLYRAVARALCEVQEARASALLRAPLASDEAGGMATLSAASLSRDPVLAEPLAKLAASRHAHVALAAEVARVLRGESNGAHATSVAPKIKEAHRIALCSELFVPLLARGSRAAGIAPALALLRDAERHLGRWLLFAELSLLSGDLRPREEARARLSAGPPSARSAWALVVWALEGAEGEPPVRPTLELVTRLSDRPSSDRDTGFLFRLARARVPSVRPMLEGLMKGARATESEVYSALHLVRDYGLVHYRRRLAEIADSNTHERVRGLAAAALFDLGERELALGAARACSASRQLPSLAWSALIGAGEKGRERAPLVTDTHLRWIQFGWVE